MEYDFNTVYEAMKAPENASALATALALNISWFC